MTAALLGCVAFWVLLYALYLLATHEPGYAARAAIVAVALGIEAQTQVRG